MITERPKQLHVWKGHEGAVISVEYVEHDAGSFVLSASVDKTAKLWTLDGLYVGTFGQVKLYILNFYYTNIIGVVANMLNCDIVVYKFELHTRYYVHFRAIALGKYLNTLFPPWHWLNSTTMVVLRGRLWP